MRHNNVTRKLLEDRSSLIRSDFHRFYVSEETYETIDFYKLGVFETIGNKLLDCHKLLNHEYFLDERLVFVFFFRKSER